MMVDATLSRPATHSVDDVFAPSVTVNCLSVSLAWLRNARMRAAAMAVDRSAAPTWGRFYVVH